jgi:hypothetical protein
MGRRLTVGAAVWVLLKFTFRYATGQHLDGQRRGDATFLTDGTEADAHYWGRGKDPWWARLAGWKRGAIRVAPWVVAWGWWKHRTATEVVLAVPVAVAVWLAVRAVRNWRHNRDWVYPLNEALPPGVTVAELTRDRNRAVLALPAGFTGDDKDKKLILQATAAKLNHTAELAPVWSLHGKRPQVMIAPLPLPPGFVGFAGIRSHADAAEEHQIVLGLGRPTKEFPAGEPCVISVDNDSPHLGMSMGSGDGKSVTARNAGGQLAHHGALIACLDPKMMSQHWAAGLPNFAYARFPAEIHELAIWLAAEVDRRNLIAMFHSDVEGKVHASVGPRIAGILEELNVTQAVLSAYWKEDLGGKGRSPAVAALDKVAFTGRQVHINLIYIGQRLSAKATSGGSSDARENLGVLLMTNPAASTWKMLVGERHALPSATSQAGRLQVVTAKTVTEVQGAYLTGAQAREYATSGVVAVPRSDMPCVGGLAPLGTPERAAQDVPDMTAIGGHGPDLHIVRDSPVHPPLAPPRITIPDAIEEGISGPTYDAVRKALSRDRGKGKPVPAVVGSRGNADEYDRVEWCDWEEARRQPRRLVR